MPLVTKAKCYLSDICFGFIMVRPLDVVVNITECCVVVSITILARQSDKSMFFQRRLVFVHA